MFLPQEKKLYEGKIDDQKIDIVTLPACPLLINAGPGTGKTTLLSYRIKYLIEELKINPESILLISFTRRAKKEIKEKIIQITSSSNIAAKSLNIFTFNGLAYNIIRKKDGENDSIDILNDFYWCESIKECLFDCVKILNQRWFDVLIDLLKRYIFCKWFFKLNDTLKETQNFSIDQNICLTYEISMLICQKNIFNQFLNNKKNSKNKQKNQHYIDEIFCEPLSSLTINKHKKSLDEFWNKYRERKNYTSEFTHDELIIYFFEMVLKNTGEINFKKYDHVIIDEFQDTNIFQYIFAKTITNTTDGIGQNIAVVGDLNQIIFNFAGSYQFIFQKFAQDFQNSTRKNLTRCYRCSKKIWHIAEQIIKSSGNFEENSFNSMECMSEIEEDPIWYTYTKDDEVSNQEEDMLDDEYTDLDDQKDVEIIYSSEEQQKRANSIYDGIKNVILNLNSGGTDFHKIVILTRTQAWAKIAHQQLLRFGVPCFLFEKEGDEFFEFLKTDYWINCLFHFLKVIDMEEFNNNYKSIFPELFHFYDKTFKSHKEDEEQEKIDIITTLILNKFEEQRKIEPMYFTDFLNNTDYWSHEIDSSYHGFFHAINNIQKNFSDSFKKKNLSDFSIVEKLINDVNKFLITSGIGFKKVKSDNGMEILLRNIKKNWQMKNCKNSNLNFLINNLYKKMNKHAEQKKENFVHIMTIHKSKGSEYDYVIIIDQPTSEKTKILDRQSSKEDLQKFIKLYELEDEISDELKDFLAADDDSQKVVDIFQGDEANVFYVAITRAKKNVIVFSIDDKETYLKQFKDLFKVIVMNYEDTKDEYY